MITIGKSGQSFQTLGKLRIKAQCCRISMFISKNVTPFDVMSSIYIYISYASQIHLKYNLIPRIKPTELVHVICSL